MMQTRFVLAGVILLGAALVGLAGSETAKTVIGTWEEVAKSDGASPGTIEFTADGKLVLRGKVNGKEFRIDGIYRIDGGKITSMIAFGGFTKTDINRLREVTDQKLVWVDDKGKREEFKRVK